MRGYLLIINVGSTSIKSRLFSADLQTAAQLAADYGDGANLTIDGRDLQGAPVAQRLETRHDTAAALTVVFGLWRQWVQTQRLTLTAIGHRVVHGATWFDKPTLVNATMLTRLAQLDRYAPLHNPYNRLGIEMATAFFPETLQYALFDTAFHRTIPDYAARYAIPEHLSAEVEFLRYGFHGLSCQHSVHAVAAWLGCEPDALNLIVLHLGGGASATAIRGGLSVDTSMGFSPTEGLLMAGRCGDLDPMIALTLQHEGWSYRQLDTLLNHDSGLRGLCGDGDMRAILARVEQGDAAARLALDMYCYRIKKYIGAYRAVLGDVSALVFTGGVGEHAPAVRAGIVAGLYPLGFSLDPTGNAQCAAGIIDIGAATGCIRILVVPAEEELVCARQILTALDNPSALNS